ncbi:MAG TPA: PaaI family thioesterase [Syntrophales bacterium]|nr:PaaI family thioesterase [Syntrophales bacterium]
MDQTTNYRLLPNMEDHECFGCGPANPSGLQMKFYTDEASVFSWVTVPPHLCGWSRLVHGGVLSTMLDEIMSRSVIYLLKRLGLTRRMEVEFLRPVFIGKELKVEGKVREYANDREVRAEGFVYDEEGRVCARSSGSFILFSTDRMRQMGVADSGILDWFDRLAGKL